MSGVKLRAAGMRPLGRVHRQVRALEQLLGRDVRVADGASASPMLSRTSTVAAVDDERFVEGLDHALGDLLGDLGRVLDEDGELVPAEPGDGVTGADSALDAVADAAQQFVADGWPRLSLTSLKSSRSATSTPTGAAVRPRNSIAWASRSLNSARLARSVNGSRRAMSATAASSRRFSSSSTNWRARATKIRTSPATRIGTLSPAYSSRAPRTTVRRAAVRRAPRRLRGASHGSTWRGRRRTSEAAQSDDVKACQPTRLR